MVDDRTRSGWSVVVRGIARDVSEHLAGLGQAAANVEPWAPGPKNVWIGIDIDDVTGRLLRGEVDLDVGQPGGLHVAACPGAGGAATRPWARRRAGTRGTAR